MHVRGNQITITGTAEENALAARLFTELIALLDKGDTLSAGRHRADREHAGEPQHASALPTC